MLRPATPLSVLLLASFILLLISTISTPVVPAIPLARVQSVNFGVFGWCKDDGTCSSPRIGWNTDQAGADDVYFLVGYDTRHSLFSLLVVHAVATFCNFVVLCLALAAHFHAPSHSARYLLGLLIFLLPTLLITLLAFLVDILLFVPHLSWGGWIVLASTILITASGVVTCAMRRTLVSRKARKKRIAENAEMSGENFYARQAAETKTHALTTEQKTPMVNGAPGADALPAFATYEAAARRSQDRQRNGMSPTGPGSATSPVEGGDRFYGERSRSNSRHRSDQASTPFLASDDVPPPMPFGARGGFGAPRGRGQYPPRGGMPGRGGFSRGPPPAGYMRGGFAPRGSPGRGRGGFGPGPGPMPMGGPMMAGGPNRRPPPPGYPPQGPGGPPHTYSPIDASNPDTRQPYQLAGDEAEAAPYSPSNYGPDGNAAFAMYSGRAPSPGQRRASPFGSRSHSPGNGQRPRSPQPEMPALPVGDTYRTARTQSSGLGYDAELEGMVDLQRNHPPMPGPPVPQQEYVPPRAGWTNNNDHRAAADIEAGRARLNSAGSEYMEDVDPKFAELGPSAPPAAVFEHEHEHAIPPMLAAGPRQYDGGAEHHTPPLLPSHSFEELPGARSPVDSETSNFTSISQRQVNPNWRPGYGGEFESFAPMQRQQQQRKQDMLFSGNPDFELPGTGLPGRGARTGYGGGMGRGITARRPLPPSALGDVTGDGRYPMPGGPSGAGSVREI